MLVLPLVVMGIVSVAGGLSGLRLPETLHYRLPQTTEEGEEFGKDFTMEDCCRCIPIKYLCHRSILKRKKHIAEGLTIL